MRGCKIPAKPSSVLAAVADADTAAALAVIEKDRQARIEACQAALNAMLQQYRCTLTPLVLVQGGQPPQLGVQMVAL